MSSFITFACLFLLVGMFLTSIWEVWKGRFHKVAIFATFFNAVIGIGIWWAIDWLYLSVSASLTVGVAMCLLIQSQGGEQWRWGKDPENWIGSILLPICSLIIAVPIQLFF